MVRLSMYPEVKLNSSPCMDVLCGNSLAPRGRRLVILHFDEECFDRAKGMWKQYGRRALAIP